MLGFPETLALEALRQGWSVNEIISLHAWGLDHNHSITQVKTSLIIIDSWFIAHPGQNIKICYEIANVQHLKNKPDPLDLWVPEIQVYCDGSGTTAKTQAGCGVVILYPDKEKKLIARHLGLGSNNVAELSGIHVALLEIPDCTAKIVIHSDSQYAIGAVTQNWNRTYNQDLIQKIRNNLALRIDPTGVSNVYFKHVQGHVGILWNEVADRLAKAGRLQQKVDFGEKLLTLMNKEAS